MAKIIIKETDYTAANVYSPTETIAYVPGMIGYDENGNKIDATNVVGKPVLVSTVADFELYFGKEPAKIVDNSEQVEYDKSFVMAKQLLANGMKVVYEVVAKKGAPSVEARTEDDMREALGVSTFWEKLNDRSLYNVRFITSGGYNGVNGASDREIATCLDTIAKKRGDCVALIDHSINSLTAATVAAEFANFELSEYSTAFTPWCKFEINTVSTSPVEGYWTLPGSFAYLLAYNNMIADTATWYAAAGARRGAIPLMIEPLFEIGEEACNTLQSREEGSIAINPICNVNPYGYRIYGNRTLLKNTNGLKAKSFLNIRNLCSDIKKVCFQACRIMAFEQNDDILWVNLKAKITPTLQAMASGEGIKAYSIKRVATDERAKVVAVIKIVPIEAVEDFEIELQLTNSLDVTTAE